MNATLRYLLPLLFVATAAQAQDGAPLYASFQAFCVRTGGTPDAVEDAVEAVGGKGRAAPDDEEPGSDVSVAAWDYRAGDEDMTIVAGTQRIPNAHGGAPRNATVCIVEAEARDDASAAAIKQWVAVAPVHVVTRNITATHYDFEQNGGVRTPAPSDSTGYEAAVAAGRIWSLTLRQSQMLTSVQLVHIVPEAKP